MALALPEPDRVIVRQRDSIVADLRKLVPLDSVIADEEGRRAFETDALTAYRRMPLAVALPASTEEVSRLLRYCHANDIKVVARGAGTSLSGGALPAEDAVVIAVSRMHRVLEIDYVNRVARVEVGITNLAISQAVAAAGFGAFGAGAALAFFSFSSPALTGDGRDSRPSRCALPITALRLTPPNSSAIWLAVAPFVHIALRRSIRSSVQLIEIQTP